jgi:hypothetical protein
MDSYYEEVPVLKIKLDIENPRIALMLQSYGPNVTAEAIALALGSGSGETTGTTFSGLRESIKTNGGVIHPIILNKKSDDEYTAIEGNTRVQIYREFEEQKVPGNWKTIRSIVYSNMDDEHIHAIRLQSHLVGPRDWDPYSKAKYLNYLSNSQKLSLNEIIDYCGGKKGEILSMITAYNDMETFYRPLLTADDEFDPRMFSYFKELIESKNRIDSLIANGFTKSDFAKWVLNGNINTASSVRKLPVILGDKKAKEVFLKSNIIEAQKLIDVPWGPGGLIENATYIQLANELIKKLANLPWSDIRKMMNDSESPERDILIDLKENIEDFLKNIKLNAEE